MKLQMRTWEAWKGVVEASDGSVRFSIHLMHDSGEPMDIPSVVEAATRELAVKVAVGLNRQEAYLAAEVEAELSRGKLR